MQNKHFWQTLKKPIVGLSPMDGVTDQPFRYIQKKYGNPDLIFTEFVSVEGLCHSAVKLLDHLIFDQSQKPIIVQFYGKTPAYFRQAAVLACQLGFDGIDINMGCPAKNVAQHGSGASLISQPELAIKIIDATKLGVQDWQNGKNIQDCPDFTQNITLKAQEMSIADEDRKKSVPVSVKTRIGHSRSIIEDWIKTLLQAKPSAITVHGRTLKQGYSGKADWQEIARAAEVARAHQDKNDLHCTLILGNGDLQSRSQGEKLAKQYDLDGVLIGRASFGNPYVFQNQLSNQEQSLPQIALEHAKVFEKTFASGGKYNFLPMRKHLGWYIKGINDAKEMRSELIKCNNSQEVKNILEKYGLG